MTRRPRLLALALVLTLAAPLPALAQLSMGGGGHGGGGGHDSSDDDDKTPAAPPAIPGAVSSPDRVAPAIKGGPDLDPNAALFDAIDRGDIAAARDALSRGADLNAKNVLGQRPIDMSIDLNRNDITFLLLSMRSQGADSSVASAPEPSSSSSSSSFASSSDEDASLPSPIHATPGGGTPNPSQGFLGFGK